jgi:hypothetical protein
MRRAILLAGITTGIAALFTTVSYAQTQRQKTVAVREFKAKLADLTFCRTGYEIAASRSHYIAGTAAGGYREAFLEYSDELEAKRKELDSMIAEHLREAKDLPMDATDRTLMIEKVQWDAEVEAVQIAGWVEEPDEFLDHLEERCQPYITE